MKTTLKLKTVTAKNNSTYYYVFNEAINDWQRINKDCFNAWSFQYFLKQKCEVVSKTPKETVYLVTKGDL